MRPDDARTGQFGTPEGARIAFRGRRWVRPLDPGNPTWRYGLNLYPTGTLLRRALRRATGRPAWSRAGRVIACCVTNPPRSGRFRDTAFELHFSADQLNAGLIAHECLHAAWAAEQLRTGGRFVRSSEERIADDTGELTEAVQTILLTDDRARKILSLEGRPCSNSPETGPGQPSHGVQPSPGPTVLPP